MARNGNIGLQNLIVTQVNLVKSGTSRIVAAKAGYTVTIETTGVFPDDLVLKPDSLIDLSLGYDPR